jgi:hypothetical protein
MIVILAITSSWVVATWWYESEERKGVEERGREEREDREERKEKIGSGGERKVEERIEETRAL